MLPNRTSSRPEPTLTSPISSSPRLKLTDTYPRETAVPSLPFPHLFVHIWAIDGGIQQENVSGGYCLSDIAMVMEVTTVSKGDRLAQGEAQQS